MSSDRFRTEHEVRPGDDRPNDGPPGVGLDARAVPNPVPGSDVAVEPTVAGRVEKAVLRAEVEALRRELERREHRHGRVVEQYEQLLQARTDAADGDDERAADRDDATVRSRLTNFLPAGGD